MKKFFNTLWRIVRFPFWLIYTILAYPFRLIGRGIRFINTDADDRPILDTFSSLATEEQARASFWDHVEALRGHLLRMVIGLAIGVGISFYFAIPLMEYMAKPVGGLTKLIAIQPTEEIGVFMRVALTSGIAIALPYLAFEIWLFAAPGLTSREKKNTLIGIPIATVLFLAGMAFTFYVLLPSALPFLGNFTAIAQTWRAGDYFGFVTGLMIWIGIFFEFPLVIYLLTSIGLVQPSVLTKQWRIAIVIIAIIAAAVTPTVDPVNMALVMLPMSLLYFISIGLSYIAYAGRQRNLSAREESV
ncbi:MAG: twin-arginine translocase subunit TatC [Byssovorax cruenta]